MNSAMDTVAFGALKAALTQNPKAAIEAIRQKAAPTDTGAAPTGQANGVGPAAGSVAVPTGAAQPGNAALKPVDQRLIPVSQRAPADPIVPTAKEDKPYEQLLALQSTKPLSESGGRKLYEVVLSDGRDSR